MAHDQSVAVASLPVFRSEDAHCRHCGQELARESTTDYCCRGCESAFRLIHGLGLSQFYELARENSTKAVEEFGSERLGYLDSEKFRQQSVTTSADGNETAFLDLQGLTCYACVWLVERAVQNADLSCKVSVNLSLGRAEVTYDPAKTSLSRVAGLIESLGYRVSAGGETGAVNQQAILRLGIAWFCFLNVMAIAFADYVDSTGEMDPTFVQLFRWVSLALSLPAVFYSARAFYEKAWSSLKQRSVSIDQSITVSIVTVFGYSLATTVIGRGPVYFDSVCGGIALLLTARLFQQRILRRTQQEIRGLLEPAEKFVRLWRDGVESTVLLTDLKKDDHFRVLPGEWIPVGAEVIRGEGEVNLEPLTGEAKWLAVRPTMKIISGAFNGESPLVLKAVEPGNQSYWLNLSSAVDDLLASKGRMKDFSDRAAVIFLFLVNGLAVALFAYFAWQGNFAEGARRAFALALIACPCAFGLTAPLVFSACAAKALRRGILFKSQRAIEELSRARHVVFDKTGTLTEGRLTVSQEQWETRALEGRSLSIVEAWTYLREMTSASHHAIARAIHSWLRERRSETLVSPVHRLVESFGSGLALYTPQGVFRLGHAVFALGKTEEDISEVTQVYFSVDHQLIARFFFEDVLLSDAKAVVKALKKQGLRLEILSGDSIQRAEAMAHRLEMYDGAQGEARPEDKAARIRRAGRDGPVVMVGNGSNDSLAMAQSSVSIAVAHSTGASRHAADVCLTRPGLSPCYQAFSLASASQKAFRRSFVFAFAYNLTGVVLAVGGWVTPGVAAALMPLSSLCIIMLATRWKEPTMNAEQRT